MEHIITVGQFNLNYKTFEISPAAVFQINHHFKRVLLLMMDKRRHEFVSDRESLPVDGVI
jgi:hypothetical protein